MINDIDIKDLPIVIEILNLAMPLMVAMTMGKDQDAFWGILEAIVSERFEDKARVREIMSPYREGSKAFGRVLNKGGAG